MSSLLMTIIVMLIIYISVYVWFFVMNEDITTFFKALLAIPILAIGISGYFVYQNHNIKIPDPRKPNSDKMVTINRTLYVNALNKKYSKLVNQTVDLSTSKTETKVKRNEIHKKVPKKEVPKTVKDFATQAIDFNESFYDSIQGKQSGLTDKQKSENDYLSSVILNRDLIGSSNIFTPNIDLGYEFYGNVEPYLPDVSYSIVMSNNGALAGVLFFSYDAKKDKINIDNVVWLKEFDRYVF